MFSLVVEFRFFIIENSCLGEIIFIVLCGNEGDVGCREIVRNNGFCLGIGFVLGGIDEGIVMFEDSIILREVVG